MSRVRFQVRTPPEPYPRRSPAMIALALLLAALGSAFDGLVVRRDPRWLLGSAVALLMAGYYGLRARAERASPCRRCGGARVGSASPLCDRCEAEAEQRPFGVRFGQGRRGFTLIEVIMTVAITATVFAMIGGILLSVITARQKIDIKLRTDKAGYGALSLLRRDLTGVYAYALGGLAFKGESSSEGGKDADRLRFVTTANVVETEDGVRPAFVEVGYRLAAGDQNDLLLFRRAEPLEGDPLTGEGEYVEILGGVQSFNLEYLDPQSNEWKERWESAESLPAAVRVKLELYLSDDIRREAAENDVELTPPLFEMTVGIPTVVTPKVGQAAAPPAPGPSPDPGAGS